LDNLINDGLGDFAAGVWPVPRLVLQCGPLE
jgi:hypothetical protein